MSYKVIFPLNSGTVYLIFTLDPVIQNYKTDINQLKDQGIDMTGLSGESVKDKIKNHIERQDKSPFVSFSVRTPVIKVEADDLENLSKRCPHICQKLSNDSQINVEKGTFPDLEAHEKLPRESQFLNLQNTNAQQTATTQPEFINTFETDITEAELELTTQPEFIAPVVTKKRSQAKRPTKKKPKSAPKNRAVQNSNQTAITDPISNDQYLFTYQVKSKTWGGQLLTPHITLTKVTGSSDYESNLEDLKKQLKGHGFILTNPKEVREQINKFLKEQQISSKFFSSSPNLRITAPDLRVLEKFPQICQKISNDPQINVEKETFSDLIAHEEMAPESPIPQPSNNTFETAITAAESEDTTQPEGFAQEFEDIFQLMFNEEQQKRENSVINLNEVYIPTINPEQQFIEEVEASKNAFVFEGGTYFEGYPTLPTSPTYGFFQNRSTESLDQIPSTPTNQEFFSGQYQHQNQFLFNSSETQPIYNDEILPPEITLAGNFNVKGTTNFRIGNTLLFKVNFESIYVCDLSQTASHNFEYVRDALNTRVEKYNHQSDKSSFKPFELVDDKFLVISGVNMLRICYEMGDVFIAKEEALPRSKKIENTIGTSEASKHYEKISSSAIRDPELRKRLGDLLNTDLKCSPPPRSKKQKT